MGTGRTARLTSRPFAVLSLMANPDTRAATPASSMAMTTTWWCCTETSAVGTPPPAAIWRAPVRWTKTHSATMVAATQVTARVAVTRRLYPGSEPAKRSTHPIHGPGRPSGRVAGACAREGVAFTKGYLGRIGDPS